MAPEQKGPRGFQASDPDPSPAGSPPLSFGTFVLSLAASAMVHLGRAADPEQPDASPPPPNLPLARQTIEILEILEQKTRGNLAAEEEKLLGSVLYDLRMAYVESASPKGS